jgi:hypothetical protein
LWHKNDHYIHWFSRQTPKNGKKIVDKSDHSSTDQIVFVFVAFSVELTSILIGVSPLHTFLRVVSMLKKSAKFDFAFQSLFIQTQAQGSKNTNRKKKDLRRSKPSV